MDNQHKTIILYSAQTDVVLEAIRRDGTCFSKPEYVQRKYGESAQIFMTTYSWFVKEAEKWIPKPEGANFPYWAFQDLYSMDATDCNIITLEVPVGEAVFFDLYDWNKIMRLSYIGENAKEEQEFNREMSACGLTNNKVMLTDFYPEWKNRIFQSWDKLFRYHSSIKSGEKIGGISVQAGLWQIKKEWIING